MTHVLITGGSGFFGGVLKRRLLSEGYACTNIDLVADPDTHSDLTSIQGDIRDKSLLQKIFGARHVQILCRRPPTAPRNSPTTPSMTIFSGPPNVDGTRNLAEAAKQSAVKKFIFLSSNCLWASNLGHDVTEDEPPNPIELYGRSKLEGEKDPRRISPADLDIITDPLSHNHRQRPPRPARHPLFEFIDDHKKV